MWQPMWKNIGPKFLSTPEREALNRMRKELKISEEFLEPMLTIKGEKALRAKVFIKTDGGTKMHRYHLFCPIVMENDQMCYKILEKIESTHDNTNSSSKMIVVSEKEFLIKLMSIFKKSSLQHELNNYKHYR